MPVAIHDRGLGTLIHHQLVAAVGVMHHMAVMAAVSNICNRQSWFDHIQSTVLVPYSSFCKKKQLLIASERTFCDSKTLHSTSTEPAACKQSLHSKLTSQPIVMQNAPIHQQRPAQAARQAVNRSSQAPVTQGSVVQLTCERLALGGKGVCFQSGSPFVILCERALPGEHLQARVNSVHKGYAEAVKVQSLKLHDNAVPPTCPHFGTCGGCTLQSVAYTAQLAEKQNQVLQTLRRVGKLDVDEHILLPALGCDTDMSDHSSGQPEAAGTSTHQTAQHPQYTSMDGAELQGVNHMLVRDIPSTHGKQTRRLYRYRNKLLFNFSSLTWEPHTGEKHTPPQGSNPMSDVEMADGGHLTHRPTLGFLRPGTADQVMPISDCHLAPPLATTIMHAVAKHANDLGLLPYNDPSGKGILKHVMIRRGAHTWLPTTTHTNSHTPANGSQSSVQHINESFQTVSEQEDTGAYLVVIATTAASAEDQKKLQVLAERLVSDIQQVVGVLHKQLPSYVCNTNQAVSREGQKFKAKAGKHHLSSKKAAATTKLSRETTKIVNPNKGVSASTEEGDDNESFVGSQSQLLVGVSHIVEHLCGLQFRVSAESFFQTNTSQAEVLYQAVARAAQLRLTDTLLDLYCGTGSIGLCLARQCKHVLGYEAIEAAVVDARFNAKLNNITNATFICGDLEGGLIRPSPAPNSMRQAKPGRSSNPLDANAVSSPGQQGSDHVENASITTWQQPDVVVVNPARAGLSQAVIRYLRACGARRIVYVSCNPATQARDLSLLCNPAATTTATSSSNMAKKGNLDTPSQDVPVTHRASLFKLVSVQPVDLFPHTDHVENVAVLDRF